MTAHRVLAPLTGLRPCRSPTGTSNPGKSTLCAKPICGAPGKLRSKIQIKLKLCEIISDSFFTTTFALVAVAVTQSAAHAHFVWATVQDGQARFALLQSVNEAPSADFETYVAKLTPTSGGKTLTLGTAKNGARFANVPNGSGVVFAESVVGTKERGGPPYLLVYDAKGAATLAAAGTKTNAPAEITARKDGSTLVVSVMQNGKPVADCETWVEWPGDMFAGDETKGTPTDAKGEVRVAWPRSDVPNGFVGARAMVNDPKTGEADGKKYQSVHHWATLSFPLESKGGDRHGSEYLRAAKRRKNDHADYPGRVGKQPPRGQHGGL